MIAIKSNIDEIINNYKQKKKNLNDIMQNISNIVALQIRDNMISEINSNINLWSKPYDGHRMVDPEHDIIITPILNGNRIEIGNIANKLTMEDGTAVNPYYFIEFGFGIKGENSPKENAMEYGWDYNINEHVKAWWFIGTDGKAHATTGRIGINFIFNSIQKYKNEWQNIIITELQKAGV